MKFLFHAIVCHVLVGDTGEKRVAEKIAKCCIRERKKGVGGTRFAVSSRISFAGGLPRAPMPRPSSQAPPFRAVTAEASGFHGF